jgi:hypothetical protein
MADGQGQTAFKFTILLNKRLEPGVALNACAHMTGALVSKATEDERLRMMFTDYIDADGGVHPVSALSLVILRADNSNQIRKVRNEALGRSLLFVDFLETMTTNTYVEQMERTHQKKESELEYWGLCLFGSSSMLREITGKFSLWK